MQRRTQLDAPPDDLAFSQLDDWRDDFDLRFRPRSHANQFLKYAVVFLPAVRIPGAVFGHRPDVNGPRADGLRPAHRNRKKMRVPKGNVSHGDRAAVWPGFYASRCGNGNVLVGERRPANRAKVIELHNESFTHAVKVRNFVERA